ncbi:MAG: hypothetical protein IID49_06320 [Proteobacteria bacterium]|nr:hypothetical protein [Pseudomonadota bacterium]MCH8951722.1 hypothetical protein [Pseudomonadota bacterium]
MHRREFAVGVGIVGILGPHVAWAVVKSKLPPEGVEIDYRVLYHGRDIGTQKVMIRQHDKADHVVVEHEVKLEVRILFAVAYSLDHRSTEIWRGFELQSIKSDTTENGDHYVVEGEATQDGFSIRKDGVAFPAPRNLVTTDSFWLASAMSAPEVMNVRTGEIAKPVIKQLGDNRWHLKAAFPHGVVEATMRFSGDFLAEADVDNEGHKIRIERIEA